MPVQVVGDQVEVQLHFGPHLLMVLLEVVLVHEHQLANRAQIAFVHGRAAVEEALRS